jgi:hypothetical protein
MLRSVLRTSTSSVSAVRPTPAAFVVARSYATDPNAKSDLRKAAQAAGQVDVTGSEKTAGQKIDQAARLAGAAKDTSPEVSWCFVFCGYIVARRVFKAAQR